MRPEREADHSLPSSAEVKNTWMYSSIPQYVLLAWCLVNLGDNFTILYRNVTLSRGEAAGVRS